jgi:hypothetical protein
MGKVISFVMALLEKGFHKTAPALIDAVFYDVPDMHLKNEDILKNFEEILNRNKTAAFGYTAFIMMFNLIPLMLYGKSFLMLSPEKRYEFLKRLIDSDFIVPRMIGVTASFPFKFGYVSSADVHGSLNVPYRKEKVCPEPEPRWMKQITPAAGFESDEVC